MNIKRPDVDVKFEEVVRYLPSAVLLYLVPSKCPIREDSSQMDSLDFKVQLAAEGYFVGCNGNEMSDACQQCRFYRR